MRASSRLIYLFYFFKVDFQFYYIYARILKVKKKKKSFFNYLYELFNLKGSLYPKTIYTTYFSFNEF